MVALSNKRALARWLRHVLENPGTHSEWVYKVAKHMPHLDYQVLDTYDIEARQERVFVVTVGTSGGTPFEINIPFLFLRGIGIETIT